jgi:hypothetical protein
MPITVEDVPDRDLRIVRCHGVISNELLREWGFSLTAFDISATRHVLVDLRDATLDVTADGVWTFADMMHQRGLDGRRRVAIVGASDVAFAYGRMYQQLLERGEMEVRVFREYEEGVHWVSSRHGMDKTPS